VQRNKEENIKGRKLNSVHLKLPEECVNSHKSTQILLQDVGVLHAFTCHHICPPILLTINAFSYQKILIRLPQNVTVTVSVKCSRIRIVCIIWSKETTTLLHSKWQQENIIHCSWILCHTQTTDKNTPACLQVIAIFNQQNSLIRPEVLE